MNELSRIGKEFEERCAEEEVAKLRAELEDISDIRVGRPKQTLRSMSWDAQERSKKEFSGNHPEVDRLRKALEEICVPSTYRTNYRICIMASRAVKTNSAFEDNEF